MKAVIDRFEGSYAVVLIGPEEIRVDLPVKLLPKGAREGSVLDVSLELDPEGEVERRKRIRAKLDRLKNKSRGKD